MTPIYAIDINQYYNTELLIKSELLQLASTIIINKLVGEFIFGMNWKAVSYREARYRESSDRKGCKNRQECTKFWGQLEKNRTYLNKFTVVASIPQNIGGDF